MTAEPPSRQYRRGNAFHELGWSRPPRAIAAGRPCQLGNWLCAAMRVHHALGMRA